MLKKIALMTVFAAASVLSFSTTVVNAAKPSLKPLAPVGAPVMKGMCGSGHC